MRTSLGIPSVTVADPPEQTPSGSLLSGDEALRFLAKASGALASSLDHELTLTTVARLMVPTLADWCTVDLSDGRGGLRRLAVTHVDSSKEAWAWEIDRRYPVDPASPSGPLQVFKSGEPEIVPEITDEMVAASARDGEHLAMLRQLDLRSYLSAPLIARDRILGTLTLVTTGLSGRHYGPADLSLVREVASRAAIAVDNSLLHAAEQRARAEAEVAVHRATRLQELSTRLTATLGLEDAAAVTVRGIVEALGAVAGSLYLLAENGTELHVVHAMGYPEDIVEQFARIPVSARLPLADAVRELRPLISQRRAERMKEYPDIAATTERVGMGTIIALPLMLRDKPIGALGLSFIENDAVSDAALSFAITLAAQCAQAVGRAQLFDAVRRSEARFRSVVESRMLGIAFWDGQRVTDANDAFLEMLRYTREDVESGKLVHAVLTPREYEEADRRATLEALSAGSCTPYEKEFFRKDGSRIPVVVGGTTFEDRKSGVFYILDVTERRRALEQLQVAQRTDAIGRLAGGVAHEINNALQGVMGFGRFVYNALAPYDPARDDVEQIQASAQRAATITQQLLAYSRRQILRPSTLDVNDVATAFSPMLRQAIGLERELVLVRAPQPANVQADRGQLEQVLLNLALNARDAMDAGGTLTITIDRRDVISPAEEGVPIAAGAYVEIGVRDTGHGMDAQTRGQVFEPFFTTKPPGQGTGLGLSVVHGIVQQSGGHITVSSAPGDGAHFRILLPAAEQVAPVAPTQPWAAPHGGSERILIADDEVAVVSFSARMLRECGYDVVTALDTREALDAFESSLRDGRRISMVVSDLVMPGGGGKELGRQITERLEQERMPAIPILYTSGYAGDEVTRRRLLDPRAEFIAKPFTPEALARAVRALLDAAPSQG